MPARLEDVMASSESTCSETRTQNNAMIEPVQLGITKPTGQQFSFDHAKL